MYDLYEISEILAEIRDTGSTLAKEDLLVEGADTEGFKEVLKFIFDPYFTTGIGQKKLDRVGSDQLGEFMSPEEIMDYLKVNSTGTDTDASIANGFIESYDDDDAEWLARSIVTKDMQIGVSVTTLNRVFGEGFIPKIGIMRGTLCPETISGMFIATEKIDGNRRLLFTRDTGPEIYTRSGKRDYGLVEIEAQMKHLPTGYVFDTECVATGYFADSIALRQASASILNRGGKRYGVKAQVFDMLSIDEYNKGRSNYHALARKAMLAIMFGDEEGVNKLLTSVGTIVNMLEPKVYTLCDPGAVSLLNNIEVLPILGIVDNKEDAIEIARPIWDAGGEGIMLVAIDSPYEVSPNPRKTLLKIKLLKEFVCECTGMEEGTNKYVGMMGAITVNYKRDKEVYSVKVGSGFTDYLRELYWDNPELIVGKMIEIESFGESKNAQGGYSINCPIFKRIKGVEE